MASCFRSDQWVGVVDLAACPHSATQVEWLKEHRTEASVRGLVRCDDPKHTDSEVCKKVPAFPAMCNVNSGHCFTGLRVARADFEALCDAQVDK